MTLPYDPPPAPPTAGAGMGAWQVWALRLVDVIRGVLTGKLNAGATLTLAENADTTTLTDPRLGPTSVILFSPLTASAAAELAAGGMYPSAQTAGEATIAHANDPATDREFRVLIIG